jgi:putative ABC transport system permease protein
LKSLKVAIFLAFTSIRKGNFGVILLTIFILAIVALNLLFVSSLLDGLVASADDKIKTTYAGDIVIESSSDNPLIADIARLTRKIENVDGVTGVAPRNNLGAELVFDTERTNCIIDGILPEKEKSVFTISQSIIEGSYLEENDYGKVLLGIQLAGADRPDIELYSRSLKKVHAGDKIQVTYANGVKKTYQVKGIFYTEFIQTDIQAFVTEKELELINPILGNKASTIQVKVNDESRIPAIIERIEQLDSDLSVLSWKSYAGIVSSLTDSFSVIKAILNVVNLLVAGITVFIVTYIDVTSRRKQIGIQRAIGITPSSITLTYLFRAVFYAVIASGVASLAFPYIVIPVEARYPFHFPFGNVYLITGVTYLARTAAILLSTAIVAAFIPVWMALRIKILDAIWG